MRGFLVVSRGEKDTSSDIQMYGRTKVFNIMASNELNRRLAGTGVVSLVRAPAWLLLQRHCA